MMSILNEGFALQQIYATGYSKTFYTGANAPVLALGIDKGKQQKGSFVIKLKAGETMTDPSANMKELLAVFIAWELEIPVAAPVLVEVSNQFLETIGDAAALEMAKRSIGLNFGTVYLDGYPTLTLGTLPDKLIPYAQNLFAFDLLIQNPDRTAKKPNMLTNGEEIVAIDHEKAFPFTLPILGPIEIWNLPEPGRDWIKQHILRNLVKGKAFDAELFMDKCERLTPEFWAKAEELIPREWKTVHFDTIKQKVSGFITNRQQFIKELQTIMS